jgi:hypothetical protein
MIDGNTQQSAFSIQPNPVYRKGRKECKGKRKEKEIIKLTAGASRFYGLNLTEGFNRRERRERRRLEVQSVF